MTTQPVTVIDADSEDEHDCLDHVVSNGLGTLVCSECGEPVDIADATCTLCGRYPCTCDDDYERYRDERMGL